MRQGLELDGQGLHSGSCAYWLGCHPDSTSLFVHWSNGNSNKYFDASVTIKWGNTPQHPTCCLAELDSRVNALSTETALRLDGLQHGHQPPRLLLHQRPVRLALNSGQSPPWQAPCRPLCLPDLSSYPTNDALPPPGDPGGKPLTLWVGSRGQGECTHGPSLGRALGAGPAWYKPAPRPEHPAPVMASECSPAP